MKFKLVLTSCVFPHPAIFAYRTRLEQRKSLRGISADDYGHFLVIHALDQKSTRWAIEAVVHPTATW